MSEITLAKDDLPTREAFDGYAFIGHGLAFSLEDVKRFSADDLHQEIPAEDGCYILLQQVGDRWILSTDHSGYRKIYLYRDGSYWAASSSLVRLAESIRSRGRRLTIDPVQFAGFNGLHSFTQQMTSSDTLFREITLVPAGKALIIRDDGTCWTDKQGAPETVGTLREYLLTWIGRIASLISAEDVKIRSELSGGIDSRTVAAILSAARNVLSLPAADVRFTSNPQPKDPRDLTVASSVAEFLGIGLETAGTKPAGRKLSSSETFQRWRDQNLGVYLPLYIQRHEIDPSAVVMSGGGGEVHRKFYPDDIFDSCAQFIPDPLLRNLWRQSVTNGAQSDRPELATISHYRCFRNRFHAGCLAQQRIAVQPLASKHLTSNLLAAASDRQIYYDIMESCAPQLSRLPYDEPHKSPSTRNLADLAIVDVSGIAIEPAQKAVRPSAAPTQLRADRLERSLRDEFCHQADLVLDKPKVAGILGQTRDNALRFMADLKEPGRIPRGMVALPLTKALSLGVALDLTLG